jgi:lysophospholipase L1-like esterase
MNPARILRAACGLAALAFPCCAPLRALAAPPPPQVPAALMAELGKSWPHNRTIHLVFHGHSVPAGYHRTPEVKPFDSYPLLTVQRVQQAHPHAVVNAIVTAIGGEDSVKGAARFSRDVLSLRPDLIFIDYALNDRRVPPAEVEKAWRSMAREAKARGVPVVFVTPTGARGVVIGDAADPLEVRAALIRRLAAEEGVLLADVWADWQAELRRGTDQDALLSQANHPNREGHEIAAGTLARLFGVR